MKEKFCFNKSLGILILVVSVLLVFALIGYKISITPTSTSSRASASKKQIKAISPTPRSEGLRAYFTIAEKISDDKKSSTYKDIYAGTGSSVQLSPQVEYVVCIENNSTDKAVGTMPYQTLSQFKNNFTLSSKGANLFEQGAIDGFSGCWSIRYDNVGSYTMAGIFTPKINGYDRVLKTQILNVTVK
jgi:hypothetical protein